MLQATNVVGAGHYEEDITVMALLTRGTKRLAEGEFNVNVTNVYVKCVLDEVSVRANEGVSTPTVGAADYIL